MAGGLLENGVEVRYRGSATLHGSENATLDARPDGVAGMLWEALVGAGWVGECASPRMTAAIRVGCREPQHPTPERLQISRVAVTRAGGPMRTALSGSSLSV